MRNVNLKNQATELSLKQMEQGIQVDRNAEELSTIKSRLKEYRDSTRQQEDMGKYQKAMTNISQASDLTELTMLALKVTEEMKRAELQQQNDL